MSELKKSIYLKCLNEIKNPVMDERVYHLTIREVLLNVQKVFSNILERKVSDLDKVLAFQIYLENQLEELRKVES